MKMNQMVITAKHGIREYKQNRNRMREREREREDIVDYSSEEKLCVDVMTKATIIVTNITVETEMFSSLSEIH
jgi:hypothetical protein